MVVSKANHIYISLVLHTQHKYKGIFWRYVQRFTYRITISGVARAKWRIRRMFVTKFVRKPLFVISSKTNHLINTPSIHTFMPWTAETLLLWFFSLNIFILKMRINSTEQVSSFIIWCGMFSKLPDFFYMSCIALMNNKQANIFDQTIGLCI